MIDPTASLTIATVGVDVVFSGVRDDSGYGLLSMDEPARQARVAYAASSPHVHGALATQATWQQSMLNATICLSADTAAALETRKQEVRDAIAQFSYTATTTINGVVTVWTCDMGSMVLTNGDLALEHLSGLYEVYNLSIPVYPVSA